ncbi:uncharacterized protein LOC106646081 [Copidosoma floridanum]|uniref:uncharacterized protein LOC106646081 n=1 Tax=Copidosoma floridanum TaxID=29053 RepID=UPI0006C97528|nr:uncharacterized protein LOC106646081 [Copidosoma floridanum]
MEQHRGKKRGKLSPPLLPNTKDVPTVGPSWCLSNSTRQNNETIRKNTWKGSAEVRRDRAGFPWKNKIMHISTWEYYFLLALVLIPVYLFFRLWSWLGWELFVNN